MMVLLSYNGSLSYIQSLGLKNSIIKSLVVIFVNLHRPNQVCFFAGKTYKRAEDVVEGDKMWVAGEFAGALFVVAEISKVTKQGLYNPYTMGGNIVVNGVVASAHSDWFLDDLFQSLNLVHLLPAVYQAVLTPVRMLYNCMGKDLYSAAYNIYDSHENIAEEGIKYTRSVITAIGVASAAAALLLSNRSKKV